MSENPKVISLFADPKIRSSFPFDKILVQKDFFLKCDAYDIYLPLVNEREDELNIFEETILRLSEINRVDLDKINQQLCLEKDFIHIILEHLKFKEYLGGDGRISEKGKDYLGRNDTDYGQNVHEKKHFQILTIKKTGEIIPYIFNTKDLPMIQTLLDKRKMTICYGSKGKQKRIDGYIWVPEKGERCLRRGIRQEDIFRIVQRYNMQNPLDIFRLSTLDTIDISKTSTEIYLHVKMIFQRGLIDSIIVSDGSSFVNGVITQYALNEQREAVSDLRKSAEQNINIRKKSLQRFMKYNDVHKAMDLAEVPKGDTVEDVKQKMFIQRQNLIRMHSALEWACAYFIQIWPVNPRLIKSFQVANCKQNQRILLKIARGLGFYINKEDECVLGHLDDLSLRQYTKSGIPNLHVLLPLVVISAKENPSSSIKNVVKKMPYIFHTFMRLSETKMLRHGNEQVEDTFDDYDLIELETKNFLKILLPYYGTEETNPIENIIRDDSSAIHLHAEENAVKLLGRDIYEKFGYQLKSDICRLALTTDRQNEMMPIDFIVCLARVEENYFRSRAKSVYVFLRKEKDELLDYLSSVLKEEKGNIELPVELMTVSPLKIKMAVKHGKGSLGAYTLVYLGNLTRLQLKGINLPFVIDVIAETLRYRKHGNEIGIHLSKKKMDSMRDDVFSIIKNLEKY